MAKDDKRIKSESGWLSIYCILNRLSLKDEIMKELFWAVYFALHFEGAFLGLVIAINLSTWLGLSMFAFFLVKFMLMMPEIKRIWTKLNYIAASLYNVKGFAHMHSQEKCIWVNMNLSPDLLGWNNCTSLRTRGLNGSGVKLEWF